MVVVLPGMADDGLSGFESLFDHANGVLEEMVSEGVITSEERARMVVQAYARQEKELLAPFSCKGKLHRLIVEDFAMSEVADAPWAQYELDGDKEALITKRALFFRSIFVPSLACALSPARAGNGAGVAAFADQVEQRLKRHLASQPGAMPSFAQTIVLAKKE